MFETDRSRFVRCNVPTSLTRLLVQLLLSSILFLSCLSDTLAVLFVLCARAPLSLSLTHTLTHIQIYTHKPKHKHKHMTGTRNSEQRYMQSDLILSFTRTMSLLCVFAPRSHCLRPGESTTFLIGHFPGGG